MSSSLLPDPSPSALVPGACFFFLLLGPWLAVTAGLPFRFLVIVGEEEERRERGREGEKERGKEREEDRRKEQERDKEEEEDSREGGKNSERERGGEGGGEVK